jgi:23S rRNA (adenine1618-N6)-methyltransferase
VFSTPKKKLHKRNAHRFGYNFEQLGDENNDLKPFIFTNKYREETIDFADSKAVLTLNKALLHTFYDVKYWDIPSGYLCPPIPGRVDYIHYLADLLASCNNGKIPEGNTVIGLDIGVGSNCIYPILGNATYGWQFVGTDIDEVALQNCIEIIEKNPKFVDEISLQLQPSSSYIFKDIISSGDRFSFTVCNPPFHESESEAIKSNLRKLNNLNEETTMLPDFNFGGKSNELWYEGGEEAFIVKMIYESTKYASQVLWFTTLVSKHNILKKVQNILKKVNVARCETIDMAQGNKISRIVAWTFLSDAQISEWDFYEEV